jgi:hypothetical protein
MVVSEAGVGPPGPVSHADGDKTTVGAVEVGTHSRETVILAIIQGSNLYILHNI